MSLQPAALEKQFIHIGRICRYLSVDLNGITYRINGAVYEVNKVLGPGFLEKVYEDALMEELKLRGLKAESQVPIDVTYKSQSVGEYFADIVVEDKVILELRAADNLNENSVGDAICSQSSLTKQ